MVRRREKKGRVYGRQVRVWGRKIALRFCDRHCGGTECAERKGGRNKRNKKNVRVPKTNLDSVIILPRLNSKGRFFNQHKGKEMKVFFRVHIPLAKRLVMCFL